MLSLFTKCALLLNLIGLATGKCSCPRLHLAAASIQGPGQVHSSITNWLAISLVDEKVANQPNLTLGLYSPDLGFMKDLETLNSAQFQKYQSLQTRVGVIINISPQDAEHPTYFVLYEPTNCTVFGMAPVKVLDVVGNAPLS
ncbi:hypothetical protein K7432_011015 [Basidiobolus ranarum]|uniref:Uncharacterized protein n=1 Tax=Basidiobolus ranarum TaxID=34480 RepID=A0ABR2VUL1_9FUNG